MNEQKMQAIIADFDDYNRKDPHTDMYNGAPAPKEYVYAVRMTEKLNQYEPQASAAVQLAARCQHIGRWEIPRNRYPMNKVGYIKWRNELKSYHAGIAEKILERHAAPDDLIERVKFLVQKKNLKNDAETQTLEDVVCLVFLEYYLGEFAAKHDEQKVIDILLKTWKKMTPKGRDAALQIDFGADVKPLIDKFASLLS